MSLLAATASPRLLLHSQCGRGQPQSTGILPPFNVCSLPYSSIVDTSPYPTPRNRTPRIACKGGSGRSPEHYEILSSACIEFRVLYSLMQHGILNDLSQMFDRDGPIGPYTRSLVYCSPPFSFRHTSPGVGTRDPMIVARRRYLQDVLSRLEPLLIMG